MQCSDHGDLIQRVTRVETTTTATHDLVVAMDKRQRAMTARLAWLGGGLAALCAGGGLLFAAARVILSVAQAAQ